MPKATIDEHSDFHIAEYKIGFAAKSLPSPPTGNAKSVEEGYQSYFRVLVPSVPDGGHDSGPFDGIENIGHSKRSA